MENKYITVSAINKYIAHKFEIDTNLKDFKIKGEISNFKVSGGHLYFSLKDDLSEIRAIMFSSYARQLLFMPSDGMKVVVTADLTVYQKGGTYNLNVKKLEDAGLGDLYLEFLKLKEKLDKEGLFSEETKKKIPEFVKSVAVITSATGDAINDITSTINKRFPLTKVYLYPSLVQGRDAPKSLVNALLRANQDNLADVIIIGRGGGSFEDLACFNDEELARTIKNSNIPVVSAIGHEADYTIADFVSDRRAPTPTGAAVIITKDQYELAKDLYAKQNLLAINYKKILEKKYYDYERVISKHHFKNFIQVIEAKENEFKIVYANLLTHSPLKVINLQIEKVNELSARIKNLNMIKKIEDKFDLVINKENSLNTNFLRRHNLLETNLNNIVSKLELVNPRNLLKKGYVLTYQDDVLITSLESLNEGKDLKVQYYDGEVITKPIKIKKGAK